MIIFSVTKRGLLLICYNCDIINALLNANELETMALNDSIM